MATKNSYFQFKQFSVQHAHCAMKVGTDAVLLGAWATLSPNSQNTTETTKEPTQAPRLLDIGTGSGVIALMGAQRHSSMRIDAIEPHADSCIDARHNFEHSSWSDRLTLIKTTLQEFNPPYRYDSIWSNPPYFVDSLACPDPDRHRARHTSTLPLEELAQGVARLLKPMGCASIILPCNEQEQLRLLLQPLGLYPCRQLLVSSTPQSKTIRTLAEYRFLAPTSQLHQQKPSTSNPSESTHCETLAIRSDEDHQYSEAYRALTRDFYLKF